MMKKLLLLPFLMAGCMHAITTYELKTAVKVGDDEVTDIRTIKDNELFFLSDKNENFFVTVSAHCRKDSYVIKAIVTQNNQMLSSPSLTAEWGKQATISLAEKKNGKKKETLHFTCIAQKK